MILKTFEWGDPTAPPLVCVHGVGGSHHAFRRAAEERWGERFRVIAVDLRGHGESGWEPPWTHATYVDDLVETVLSLGVSRAMWVGVSFGGRLLLQLAASRPDLVDRAAILEPVLQLTAELTMKRASEELVAGTWASKDDFVASRSNTGPVSVETYWATYGGNFDVDTDGTVRRLTFQPAIVSIFSEFAAPAAAPESISVPMMLLYAPAFGMVTPEQRAAFEPHLEQVVEVPGMHSVLTTAFEETTSAVSGFLNTVRT